jgi:hypothetical protein
MLGRGLWLGALALGPLGGAQRLGAAQGAFCPAAFQRIGSGCYFYGYFRLNWFRAMEFCHSFGAGASLATLDTRADNRRVKAWLLEHGG